VKKTIALILSILLFGTLNCGRTLNRQDLITLMDQYLAALAKHDSSGLPLAPDVQLVENTEKIPIGKGLWETAAADPTDFKIVAADPVSGQIGFMGVIGNRQSPTIAAIRLKVTGGLITEIDHLVIPPYGPGLNPNMSKVRPGLLATVKKSERVPRDQLLKIANLYYEAIIGENGKIAPFADDCQRRENGGITANDQTQTPEEAAKDDFSVFRKMSCSDQLSTGVMSYITEITDRRLLAADPETGLVFAFSIFRHNGEPKVMKITGVPGITERPNTYGPFDLPAAHVFKIRNGQIHEIEAIGYIAQHGIRNGWD